MRKIKLFLMLLLVGLVLPTTILAEEKNVETSDQLVSCVETSGNVCKLSKNVVLTTYVEVGGNVIVDLNGHSITPADSFPALPHRSIFTVLRGGILTINDSVGNGKISVGSSTSIYSAIKVTKTDEGANGKVATVKVNGGILEGYYYAITGNGSRHDTNIIINGGVIKGLEETESLGIFNPQDGNVTINGGTISGVTGIEMRSGTLVVNDGTIIGTGNTLKVSPNGSGSTTIGTGIAIVQHNTKKAISVKITGGTIKGKAALYESNPQGNSKADIDKVSIEISGGTFNAVNGGSVAIYSENKVNFISGGTFSSDVTNYVKTNYNVTKSGENYVVSRTSDQVNVPVVDPTKGTDAIKEITIGISLNNKEAENILLESLDSSSLVANDNVEVALEIEQIDASNLEKNLIKKIENVIKNGTIASYFDINVAVRDVASRNLIGNLSELTKKIELMILLPKELKNTNKDINRTYYIVREHNGKIEKIETKLSEDENYLVFETDKFSTYALAYEDANVEEVLPPKTYDDIGMYVVIGLLSFVCIGGVNIFVKKKKLFNH